MVSFKEMMKELDYDKCMIVDALNLCFRWKHKGSLVFAKDFVSTVKSLARSYDCGNVIITADWGGSTFRKEVFPEYKAQRKEQYEKQSEEEKEYMKKFFEEYEATLEECEDNGFPVFRYKGVEADDIAAYLVTHKKDYLWEEIWLISSDRDWDLLIEEGVNRFSYVNRREFTVETWPYDVSREEYISLKVLEGDKGDNIPGIEGIGPKRAAGLIEKYGSAYDIYSACPLPGKAKYIQSLNENCEQILLNYELMDLRSYCQDAIGSLNVADMHRRLVFEN